jgi:ribosomal protein S18 acetylase RimI-like enzyme
VIRAAAAADLPSVVALWELAGGPTRTPPSIENAERLFARDRQALLVAEEGGVVVGTLGAGRIDAMVNDGNAGAREFWAAAGFVLDDGDSRWSRPV